jgi:hypothetical protein
MELMKMVKLVLLLGMIGFGIRGCIAIPKHTLAYSTWGYFLVAGMEMWVLICEGRFGTKPHSRGFWVLCQLSWGANLLIVAVFWGYLYFTDIVRAMWQKDASMHKRLVIVHTLPLLILLKELFYRRIEYRDGDLKWMAIYQAFYGAISWSYSYVTQSSIYPMLTWRDGRSILFIVISCLLLIGFHYLGRQLTLCFPNRESSLDIQRPRALQIRKEN